MLRLDCRRSAFRARKWDSSLKIDEIPCCLTRRHELQRRSFPPVRHRCRKWHEWTLCTRRLFALPPLISTDHHLCWQRRAPLPRRHSSRTCSPSRSLSHRSSRLILAIPVSASRLARQYHRFQGWRRRYLQSGAIQSISGHCTPCLASLPVCPRYLRLYYHRQRSFLVPVRLLPNLLRHLDKYQRSGPTS